MARELILIPKMKYEQLMNSECVKDSKHEELKANVETQNITPNNHAEENPPTLRDVKEGHQSKTMVDDDIKPYVQMKPKEFLKTKKRVKSTDVVKQKWMTFHI